MCGRTHFYYQVDFCEMIFGYSIDVAFGGFNFIGAKNYQEGHQANNRRKTKNKVAFGSVYDPNLVPRGTWTTPEVASVGLTEEQAEDQDLEIDVGYFPYSINGFSIARNETFGAVKIIADEEYRIIYGVHIVGPAATELIGEAVLAMQLEYTTEELARGIRLHPSFSETVVDAARDAEKWALYLPKKS